MVSPAPPVAERLTIPGPHELPATTEGGAKTATIFFVFLGDLLKL